jgi:hypothetical protein
VTRGFEISQRRGRLGTRAGRADQKLQSSTAVRYEDDCVAGLRGLELADVILTRPLESCGNFIGLRNIMGPETFRNPYYVIAVQHARRGAAALGLSLDIAEVSAVSELDASFRAMGQKSPDAALVIADPFLAHERVLLAKLLVEHRLPSISAYHECAVAGGLMAYMTRYYDIFRREATFRQDFQGRQAG